VFVPPRGEQVRVSGGVLRPATYEIKPNETIGDVIRMAGGLTPLADRRRIQIDRIVPANERTTAGRDRAMIDVQAELMNTQPARGGDVVRVYEIAKRVANRVMVLGDVWSPGAVALTNGLTLRDAFRRVGGLKPDAFLGTVLISRLRPDSTRFMLRSSLSDTTGAADNNITLADGDEITVFSTTEMRAQRFVTVGGAVKRPGVQIPYREGMTMRDAVLMAGGLVEGALLTEAEIASLPENRGGGVTAITAKVPLDSTFLFDRGADGRLVVPPGIVVPTERAPQFLLRPYDVILIKWQPDWQLQQTVSLRGEIQYPGDYPLVTKTERLSDLLTRAGGFTTSAYPGGVVFVRRRNQIGRVGIDLPAVIRDPRHVDNLQLVDGDSIFIPRFTPVVTIRGSVNSPVGAPYVRGEKLSYYVRSAGGPNVQGDRDHAYVVQPNGKVETSRRKLFFWTSQPEPQPGSTVIVPVKDPNDKRDWVSIATAATSILGSLVAIAAIVRK
jgi:polysaccharide export outer membrane protein